MNHINIYVYRNACQQIGTENFHFQKEVNTNTLSMHIMSIVNANSISFDKENMSFTLKYQFHQNLLSYYTHFNGN